MRQDPHDTPRIDLSSLLRRQVDVVVAEPHTPAEAAGTAAPVATAWESPAPPAAPVVMAAPLLTDTVVEDGQAREVVAPLPDFLRRQAQRPSAWWEWGLVACLGLALILQVLLADRDRLATESTWRPLLTTLCDRLGCSLPLWHQPSALTLVHRNVAPLPGHPDILEIQAEFRNDARWPQALPVIELTLSTADGQITGQQAFIPQHYLPDRATTAIQPGQNIKARWLVAEPELPADAFHFQFR